MSERLAEVGRRITVVRQLGAVVNAMRGVAGSRAQQSRTRLPAIRAYAETAVNAISAARRLEANAPTAPATFHGAPGLIVFGAEQGFAGAFIELALNAAESEIADSHVFLVGSRAASIAKDRGLKVDWMRSLPNSVAAIADAASAIVDAVYAWLAEAGAARVGMLYPVWVPGRGAEIWKRSLLPLDIKATSSDGSGPPPLVNLPTTELIARLAQEYIFAQICEAALEAFAAENEARAATMAAAKTNIDARLAALEAEERLTRQEEITAEVVELAAATRLRRADRWDAGGKEEGPEARGQSRGSNRRDPAPR